LIRRSTECVDDIKRHQRSSEEIHLIPYECVSQSEGLGAVFLRNEPFHHYRSVYYCLFHLTESLQARITLVLSYPFGATIRNLSLSITASALLGASPSFIRSLIALRTTSLQLTSFICSMRFLVSLSILTVITLMITSTITSLAGSLFKRIRVYIRT